MNLLKVLKERVEIRETYPATRVVLYLVWWMKEAYKFTMSQGGSDDRTRLGNLPSLYSEILRHEERGVYCRLHSQWTKGRHSHGSR